MKKLAAIILGTVIAGSAAFAQATNVLSRNAVGYIKKDVGPGQLELVSVPFNPLDESANVLSNVFATASNLTQVSFWDRGLNLYRTIQKSKSTWGNAGTNVIPRGEGIFIQSPQSVAQTFYFMGEVPDSFTAPSTTVFIAEGLNAVALAYPVTLNWTSTPAASELPNLTQISFWNGTNYQTYQKAKGSWGTASNLTIQPGQAIFIQKPAGSGGTYEWRQAKPYSWP